VNLDIYQDIMKVGMKTFIQALIDNLIEAQIGIMDSR